MFDYYVIEFTENFDSRINDRVYMKGKRVIAWVDGESYRIANNDLDYVPMLITKQIYNVNFKEI
jgi:uncharacterized protein YjhX (UPF0386 family)